MNTVEPIKNLDDIKLIKQELLKGSYRDYLLFVLGINCGLRISDLLSLTVGQVRAGKVSIREGKTNKEKVFPLNNACMEALAPYIKGKTDEQYLFSSRTTKYKGSSIEVKERPITRVQAYRVLNSACKRAGLDHIEIGTHSLRKSWGYWHYQYNRDVAFLMTVFNHQSQSCTLRYIGIAQEEINKYYHEVNL